MPDVTSTSRYIHSPRTSEFLATLVETAREYVVPYPAGFWFYRAQEGHDVKDLADHRKEFMPREVPYPHPEERMFPQTDRAKEGRANSKGN